MNSLRVRLMVWLLVPLALYIAVSGWLDWQSDNRTAGIMQDENLVASARVISGSLQWSGGVLTADIPPSALEVFVELPRDEAPMETPSDHVYYRVQTDDGRLLAGLADLPSGSVPAGGPPAFATAAYRGATVRMVTLVRTMYDLDHPRTVSITVAQTRSGVARMRRELWRPAFRNLLVMLVLTIVLAAICLTIELRPILLLKKEVSDLDPDALQPLKMRELHTELRPVVEAINQYVQRLSVQIRTRRRFVAAAAHQLRTPLAVMETQIEAAMRGSPGDADTASWKALRATCRGMSELTAKLLLLAQAEAAAGASTLNASVDMLPLCTQVLEDAAAVAEYKNIDLGFETHCDRAPVALHPGLAQAMLANLVDNALRYTDVGGKVTVSLQTDAGDVIVAVRDNGPGIHAEARDRVFEPFYRHAPLGQPGSGLGLAIVREVVVTHGGQITLAEGLDGRGVGMVLRFQLAQQDSIR
jgi:two-component system sensor histidine kinase TctE